MKKLSDKEQIKLLKAQQKVLLKALDFYADPTTYFAHSVAVDPPCGDFYRDASKIEPKYEEHFQWDAYRGNDEYYYGKKARDAYIKVQALWEKAHPELNDNNDNE